MRQTDLGIKSISPALSTVSLYVHEAEADSGNRSRSSPRSVKSTSLKKSQTQTFTQTYPQKYKMRNVKVSKLMNKKDGHQQSIFLVHFLTCCSTFVLSEDTSIPTYWDDINVRTCIPQLEKVYCDMGHDVEEK